ncbi:MAG: NUDIX hydrolase [Bacteroidota bacterium]
MTNNTPIPVTAAGGVLFRMVTGEPEVLLIKTRGDWELPKGKRELESVPACAVREVAEEVGIPIPMIVSFLMETEHHYPYKGNTVKKITHWYLMSEQEGSNQFTPQKEEGIEEVRWERIERAMDEVAFSNLREVLVKANLLLKTKKVRHV